VITASGDAERTAALTAAGAEVVRVAPAEGGVDLAAALTLLAARQVNELLVECGPGLAGALLAAGLADELVLYLAPTLLGTDAQPLADLPAPASMADRLEFSIVERHDIGDDLVLRLRPRH
jgi:diaminohydroxyphosphoribosylaminopyrimidine deaminase/5-amino-6-(5-phosphoribosylamino)uracil reductase